MERLHEIHVQFTDLSAEIKFNRIFKEYTFHKMRYDRGLYGSAVTIDQLANIRIQCRLLYADLKDLDPVRTLKEVPPLKISV